MKYINPLFLSLFSLFFLLSCDNEPIDFTESTEPEPLPQADLIVGNWNLTEAILLDATATLDINGSPVVTPITGSGRDYDLQILFTEDDEVVATGSYVQNITISFGLQTLDELQEIQATEVLNSGTWSRSTALLTVDNGIETQQMNILELDETTLVLEFTFTQEQEIQETPAVVAGDIKFTFQRL